MKAEDIHTVLVIGAGTMGSQIALQCALHGLDVNLYDISLEALERVMKAIDTYLEGMVEWGALPHILATPARERIHPTADPEWAAAHVDLVSESVPEDPELKGRVFAQFNALCPSSTIFTTNTSTLLPSMYSAATGRPERFAALHFHSYVWVSNVVDVMPYPGTSAETLDIVEAFARRIGQIPIRLSREHSSYVFNTLLNSVLRSALSLAASEVTSFETVDRAWMGIMKTSAGPFGILDLVGLDTAYEINRYWAETLHDPEVERNATFLKSYVDQGRLGIKTGRGFYTYPSPAFEHPGFVEGESMWNEQNG